MNRQKKLKQLFKAQAKKASAKLAPVKKNKYISKADRLKLAAEAGPTDDFQPRAIMERASGSVSETCLSGDSLS